MNRFSIEQYQPYSPMGKTCATRPIHDKKVTWPYVPEDMINGRFKRRMINQKDFDKAAELWRSAYPEIYGSSSKYEWLLYPEQYGGKVAVSEHWQEDRMEKAFCMPVVEDVLSGVLAGGALYSKDDRNLHVEFSFGAIHPQYRKGSSGEKLPAAILDYLKLLEEESGTEYLSAFCETWQNISQYLCLKVWGWKLAGIFPGQYTRWCGGNNEYRGCTVHFYKLVGDAEKYSSKPEEWEMIPEVKKLWNVLEEINKQE